MAEKDGRITYAMKSIQEDIRSGQFRQVYLLYGEEKYLRDQYRQKLMQALAPDGGGMNVHLYEGKGIDMQEIISQAETIPFFAERRVILVQDSGFFKGKADLLADYMGSLPDYLVMIFSEDEVDKRSRLYKAVQKHGHAAEFAAQNSDTLMRWVLGRMSHEGKKITRRDMEHFLTLAGTDMANISSELEKLLSYTLGREVITGADIDAVCVPQVTSQIFDMVRAVAAHQEKQALELYYDLLSLREPPMRILFLLARQFNQILQIRELQNARLPQKEIAAKTGLPPFVVSRYGPLCRQYSSERLREIIEELTASEEAVKTGRLDDTLSVEMAICSLSASAG